MENNTPILYVMVGLPGSGKSHIAEELSKEKNAMTVSLIIWIDRILYHLMLSIKWQVNLAIRQKQRGLQKL